MLRGHVSVCVCVRARVLSSAACVICFWLGAEPSPHDWFVVPVMSRRAQRRNEKATVLPRPPLSLVSSCPRVLTSFFSFVDDARFLLFVSLEHVHLQLRLFGRELSLVFSGEMFFFGEKRWPLDRAVQQLYEKLQANTKLDFFPPL